MAKVPPPSPSASPQPGSCNLSFWKRRRMASLVDLDNGLKDAVQRFEADASCGRSQGPYKIASECYASTFEVWSLNQERRWKLCFIGNEQDSNIGAIFFFGDPSRLHELLPCMIMCWLALQLHEAGIEDTEDVLAPIGSTMLTLKLLDGLCLQKEPDAAWVPAGAINSFPSIVLEVAVRNETVPRLKQEIRWWSEAGAAISLGIKVDARMRNGIMQHSLLFFMMDHDVGLGLLHEIDFSPSNCTAKNRDQFIVCIPFSKFLRGMGPPELAEASFKLDLYKLQQKILQVNIKEYIPDDDFCFCRAAHEISEVVICSNVDCKVAVFHMDCVDATEEDQRCTGSWLCPYCR